MYRAPLFAAETKEILNIFQTVLMAIYRAIKDAFVYKESSTSICKAAELNIPKQVLNDCAAIYAHKVVNTKKP